MVFNSIAFDVLDQYKNNKLTKDDALTKLNNLLDYVRTNEVEDKKRVKAA